MTRRGSLRRRHALRTARPVGALVDPQGPARSVADNDIPLCTIAKVRVGAARPGRRAEGQQLLLKRKINAMASEASAVMCLSRVSPGKNLGESLELVTDTVGHCSTIVKWTGPTERTTCGIAMVLRLPGRTSLSRTPGRFELFPILRADPGAAFALSGIHHQLDVCSPSSRSPRAM